MMGLRNLNKRFGANKGVFRADKDGIGANKAVLALVFARTLPSTVREASARKGVSCANIVRFSANQGLALKFPVFVLYLCQ